MFGAGTDYCLLLVSRYGARLRRTGLGCGRPASGDSGSGAADGRERHDRDRGAADDAGRRLRRLPHVRARDCDRDRGRPALRSHAAARHPPPPRAPRVLAERRVGRLGSGAEPERGSARWREIGAARSPAAGGLPRCVRPHPARRARRASRSGTPTSIRSGSSGRRTTRARATQILKSAFPPGTVNPTSILVDRTDGPVQPADLAAVSDRATSVRGVARVIDTGQRSTDGRAAILSHDLHGRSLSPRRRSTEREDVETRPGGLRARGPRPRRRRAPPSASTHASRRAATRR